MSFRANRPPAWLLGLGLLALAAPRLLGGDTVVKASEAEIAVEKATRAKLEKALAVDPKNQALRVQLAETLSDLGAYGDESASDAAVKMLQALRKEFPKDATILCDCGNACTIYAQFVSVFSQLSWVHDGFEQMDAAVKAASDNAGIRITRAINSSQVPAILGREKLAREDFAWLMARIKSNPKDFTADQMRVVYYYFGSFALDHDEAGAVQLFTLAAAVPVAADDPFAPRIAASLKTARLKFPASAPAPTTVPSPAAPAASATSSPPVAKNP